MTDEADDSGGSLDLPSENGLCVHRFLSLPEQPPELRRIRIEMALNAITIS